MLLSFQCGTRCHDKTSVTGGLRIMPFSGEQSDLGVDISFVELFSSLIPLHARSCDKYFCLRYLRSLETSLLLTRFLLHSQDLLVACCYQSNYSQITVRYTLIWGGRVSFVPALSHIFITPISRTYFKLMQEGKEKKITENKCLETDFFLIW